MGVLRRLGWWRRDPDAWECEVQRLATPQFGYASGVLGQSAEAIHDGAPATAQAL